MISQLSRSVAVVVILSVTLTASASSFTWDGGGPNSSVATGANWSGDVAPNFDAGTDDVTFDGAVNTSPQLRPGLVGDYNSDGIVDGGDFIVWQRDPGSNGGGAGLAAIKANFGTTGVGTGDAVTGLTFASGAAAFTIQGAGGGFLSVAGPLNNNSSNTQTFNARVRLQEATVGNANPIVFNGGVELSAPNNAATTFNIAADVTINGAISSLAGNTSIQKEGAGTLVLNGPSTFNGALNIGNAAAGGSGAVRVTNSNALGSSANDADNQTRTFGGFVADGRLELANNVTLNERIRIDGRFNDFAAIQSVGGNNVLDGPWNVAGGGGAYNFSVDAGSTLAVTQPFYTTAAGARWLQTFGEGNITFGSVGSINTNLASIPDLRVLHQGTGVLTLDGNDNRRISFIQANNGGTVKLGANFGNQGTDPNYPLFSPTDDLNVTAHLLVDTPDSTIDVSAFPSFTYQYDITGNGGKYVGNYNLIEGGYIAPGSIDHLTYDLGQKVSTLNFQNNLDLSAGGSFIWNLGEFSTDNPGVDFDQITVGGSLTLGGTSKLTLDFTPLGSDPTSGLTFWNSAHSWKIIDTTANSAATTFATINNGTFASGSFSTSVVGGDVFLNFTPTGGATAVPEPSLSILAALAVAGLSTEVRRRARNSCWRRLSS
jgi:autotransporter-associated beta strand protein